MKILLVIIMVGFFGSFVNGQKTIDDDFFKLSFKVKNKNICLEDSIDIVAKLYNSDNNPIVVDVNQIGSKIFFDLINKENEVDLYGSVGVDSISRHSRPDFIILRPKESYTKTFRFVFDPDNFSKGRIYQMQIKYDQHKEAKFKNIDVWKGEVSSNKVIIFIKKCEK